MASIKAQLTQKRKVRKQNYDQTSEPLTPLTPNQVVRLKTQKGHNKVGVTLWQSTLICSRGQ